MKHYPDAGHLGVALVDRSFTELGWVFRAQPIDNGVDALAELTANGVPLGRQLALVIKVGPSFFAESTDEGWIYRQKDKGGHLRYWLGHTLPVLIILCDLDTEVLYWQHVTAENASYDRDDSTIVIPRNQVISVEALGRLTTVAVTGTSPRLRARTTFAGPDDVRDALRRLGPAALLGVRECTWLDVKGGVYPLDLPTGQEELAKDVAAFANTRTGGLLLVGVSTRVENDEEILDRLKPFPRELVDLDRHRKIIASRVMPPLRDVTVDWVDCGDQRGILLLDVPVQPSSNQPFVVPAPTGTEKVSKVAAGVPIRQGDSTVWLPPHEIQRLAALGWARSDTSVDTLATAASEPVGQDLGHAKVTIGEGSPEWRGAFQQAFNELAHQGLWLGDAATATYAVGPGVAQHFETPMEPFGWVLCARPGQKPVAVAGQVWQALQDVGSGVLHGDALAAVGFPIGDDAATTVVDRDTLTVELAGGQWGRGLLRRASDGQDWRWEPLPIPDTIMSAASRNWTGTSAVPQLRARVLTTLPWADTEDLTITRKRLDGLVQNLPSSEFAGIPAALSRRRGGELRAAAWVPGAHHNDSDRLSYVSEIGIVGNTALMSAEVMMTLPNAATTSAVVTCAEVRVESLAAWATALNPKADDAASIDVRWSITDVFDFFVAAWHVTTEMLPAVAMNDPARRRRWSGTPRVELWIGADQPRDGAKTVLLEDVIDLTAFGDSDRLNHMIEMMIAIPATPGLALDVRRRTARRALIEMAHRFGFLGADESSF